MVNEYLPTTRTRLLDYYLPHRVGQLFCVRQQHREGIDFLFQDLRLEAPSPFFDLILCRYVAFTYFALPLQRQVLGRIVERLLPNGYLVIGSHERLPGDVVTPAPLAGSPQIFQKTATPQH